MTDKVTRRTVLQAAAAAAAFLGAGGGAQGAQASKAGAQATRSILAYLEGLARPDGGYGWRDQVDSHVTPTFAAVGCYHVLGQAAPRKDALAQYLRTHHPIRGENPETKLHTGVLRTFAYQQMQSLRWLGAEVGELEAEARGWVKPAPYPAMYERQQFPLFYQEMLPFICRETLGLPAADISPELVAYLGSRRRANGSFNNTPAADTSDGNVMNTWWGLQALRTLGRLAEKRDETVAWLQGCQLPNGGFTHQPKATLGARDDVAYTWAAARALEALSAAPRDKEACVRYLQSLWNADGGFGDRPGLPSRAEATYYALDALRALGALGTLTQPPARPARAVTALPAGLKVYTLQIEAPGNGSPADAVELARGLKIDLWGAKNSEPGWAAAAQAIADRRKVPVTFFTANEEYGTYIGVPGMGVYSHMSDPIAPPGVEFGATMSGQDPAWTRFRDERIGALRKAGGRMIWQICDNEELSRILLDEGSYAGISTFHFGCWNMAFTLPFVFRYRDEIPFVALQDAHGGQTWWWADQLTGFRNLFLGTEPTWQAWLQALERQWVVAVRHDFVTRFRTRLMGGAPGVQELVREREAEWKWWGDQAEELRRPLLSLVAVKPGDRFEVEAPERGVTLRVRPWWQNTPRGTPKEKLSEMASLTVDGRAVPYQPVEKRNPQGPVDCYFVAQLPDLAPGKHTAEAAIKRLDTGALVKQAIEFEVR